jgi:hypothetical protein
LVVVLKIMAPSVTESASLCVVVKTGGKKAPVVPTVLISVASIFPVAPLIVIPVPTLIELLDGSNVIELVPTVRIPVTLASP